MPYDAAVSIPTLTGSLLSCCATFCVLVSYLAYSQQKLCFRHALIFNLALSDFLNSLNNSISGIYVVRTRGAVPAGPACTFNGWFGQMTVQAADFSILAIAIMTMLTVTKKTYLPDVSLWKKFMVCGSVWVVPLITSSTAAGLHEIDSVSGNWCWIDKDRTALRYALGHGWRFTIILSTVCIYAYIHYYLRRHFADIQEIHNPNLTGRPFGQNGSRSEKTIDPKVVITDHSTAVTGNVRPVSAAPKRASIFVEDLDESEIGFDDSMRKEFAPLRPYTNTDSMSMRGIGADTDSIVATPLHSDSKTALVPTPSLTHLADPTTTTTSLTHTTPYPNRWSATSIQTHLAQQAARRASTVEREIQCMLLLNAYPVMYVLLWVPGIINRVLEATTGRSYEWLSVLQASTQYVGLANALTYGFNEHLRGRVRRDVKGWRNARWLVWCV